MEPVITTTKEFDASINSYLAELAAKRKEILDADKDTADFQLPTRNGIINDVVYGIGADEDGEYYNNWGVTDNYDSDAPFYCKVNIETDEDDNWTSIELYI